MSKNGNSSNDFHKYCDYKGPTLVIAETSKNKKFGGFTPLDWCIKKKVEERGIFDKSNQTFIFSLNLKKKYDMIDINKTSICCSPKVGPDFGFDDFGFRKNMKEGFIYANDQTNFFLIII